MPSYKTHSIHGDVIFDKLDKKTDIDKEDFKKFCIGPDALVFTDYKTFKYQHCNNTREYFETMLSLIKDNKLQNNEEVMSFLYGQLDHYVLDITMHPLIYYLTEDIKTKYKLGAHCIVENWIDDYLMQKYNKKDLLYYKKSLIREKKLIEMINNLYYKVFKVRCAGIKYSIDIYLFTLLDYIIKRDPTKLYSLINRIGDFRNIVYEDRYNRAKVFLNQKNELWLNPETGEERRESFEELWSKSIEDSLTTIEDVNNYLYQDKALNNAFISNNISYNTGLPCERGQKFSFVKKYKR